MVSRGFIWKEPDVVSGRRVLSKIVPRVPLLNKRLSANTTVISDSELDRL